MLWSAKGRASRPEFFFFERASGVIPKRAPAGQSKQSPIRGPGKVNAL
jgi:hypothetical protein